MGFLESLGEGLRGAGSVLSQDVYDRSRDEEAQATKLRLQQSQFYAGQIIKAAETGAISPEAATQAMGRLGLTLPPGALGPNAQSRLYAQHADTAANQSRLDQELLNDPTILQDPEKLRMYAARMIATRKAGGATMMSQSQKMADAQEAKKLFAPPAQAQPQATLPPSPQDALQVAPVPIADPKTAANIERAQANVAALTRELATVGSGAGDRSRIIKDELAQETAILAKLQGGTAPQETQQPSEPPAQQFTRQQLIQMSSSPNPQIREQGKILLRQQFADDQRIKKEEAALTLVKAREKAIAERTPKPSDKGNDTTGDLSAQAIDNKAHMALYDPSWRVGYGRDTRSLKLIENRMAEIMKEGGISPNDVVSGRAGFAADKTSLNKLVPQYDAVTAFEKNAKRNGDVLLGLVDKVDSTGVPVVERWIRAGKKSIKGDADVAEFNAQLQIYRTEAARILTNPNLSGVLTDSARHEVEGFLGGNDSAAQIKRVVGRLNKDFDFRKTTMEDQINTVRQRMKGHMVGAASEKAAGVVDPAEPVTPAVASDLQQRLDRYKPKVQ